MVGLIELIGSSFPLLANALTKPGANLLISLISKLFGINSNSIDDITKAISNDPEANIKLKRLEDEHCEALKKIESSDYAISVEDRKDARKNSVLYKDFLRHLAYIVTFGFFGCLCLLIFKFDINNNARDLLSMLIGMLASKWQTIIDFFYGSSHRKLAGK